MDLRFPTREVVQSIKKMMDTAGRTPRLLALLGRAYALSDMESEARKVLREMREKGKAQYVSPLHFAELYANLDRSDEAFLWLDKAYEERNPAIPFLRTEHLLTPLHPDARFRKLLEQMNFPD